MIRSDKNRNKFSEIQTAESLLPWFKSHSNHPFSWTSSLEWVQMVLNVRRWMKAPDARRPSPMRPPGAAYCRSLCSANRDTILEKMGLHISFPSWSLDTIPGRTSISWPTYRSDKQKTTRFQIRAWTSAAVYSASLYLQHALQDAASRHASLQVVYLAARFVHVEGPDDWSRRLTDEDKSRIETSSNWWPFFIPMSLGSEVKSLTGTGIFLTMYSQTTSMLYFSCAEMGMMGAPSATVPAGETTQASVPSLRRT